MMLLMTQVIGPEAVGGGGRGKLIVDTAVKCVHVINTLSKVGGGRGRGGWSPLSPVLSPARSTEVTAHVFSYACHSTAAIAP